MDRSVANANMEPEKEQDLSIEVKSDGSRVCESDVIRTNDTEMNYDPNESMIGVNLRSEDNLNFSDTSNINKVSDAESTLEDITSLPSDLASEVSDTKDHKTVDSNNNSIEFSKVVKSPGADTVTKHLDEEEVKVTLSYRGLDIPLIQSGNVDKAAMKRETDSELGKRTGAIPKDIDKLKTKGNTSHNDDVIHTSHNPTEVEKDIESTSELGRELYLGKLQS